MATAQRAEVRPADLESLPPHRQEQLRRLVRVRQAVLHLETASVLERRAEHVASPVLASLLRERAGERRRRGERLLADPPEARPVRRRLAR